MADIGELRWKITGDTRDIDKSLKKTDTGIGKVGKAFLAAFAGAAILAGVKKLIGFLGQASEAAAVQESAIVRLGAALEATGQAGDDALGDLQAFASEMQGLTVIGDEVTLGLLQTAINMGLTADQAESATQQAIALSRAYGIGLDTALLGVTNTLQGQTSTLTRYIPSLKTAANETERIAILNEEAALAWAVTTAEVDTAAGVQEQLNNAIGDSFELIGDGVNEVLTPYRAILRDIVSLNNQEIAQRRELDSARENTLAGQFELVDQTVILREDLRLLREEQAKLTRGDFYSEEEYDSAVNGFNNIIAAVEEQLGVFDAVATGVVSTQDRITLAAETGQAALVRNAAARRVQAEEDAAAELERLALVREANDFLAATTIENAELRAQAEAEFIASIARGQLEQVEREREAEEARHAERLANLKSELSVYSSYAQSISQIFNNLIQIQLQGDDELSEQRKKNIILLYRIQQAAAIAEIGINTARAIVGFLANPGGFAGIALSVVAGALGATQAAVVAATPPPQMAEGGIVPARPGGTQVILGEGGEDEIVTSERRMAEFMGGNGGRPIILQIDSEVLARWMQGQLDNRGIVVPEGSVV